MKRTFFIVLLAIFFTFDIFFAISTAVAENIHNSPNAEILHPSEATEVILKDISQVNPTESGILMHNQ
ncbi:MAG: hypothetical protein MJK14_00405 [Rivularia sp. ALOHA_DT_140]|nr:hypothetical protein [Rivularia sp. ALOHA_DT_140]